MVLDQSFTTNDGDWPCGANSNTTYATQGVKCGLAGKIEAVDLYLKKLGTPTMTFYVGIWSVDGSQNPDALVSDETALDPSSLDTSYSWEQILITGSPEFAVNDDLQIVVRAGAVDSDNRMAWGSDSNQGYANGESYRASDGVTWTDTGRDLNFKTYVSSGVAGGIKALMMGVG
jgi:hypothetical protein